METSHDSKMSSGIKPSSSNEGLEEKEEGMQHLQHHHSEMSKKTGFFEDTTGYQLLRMDELEKWYSGDLSGLLDQPCGSSQWLNFWS